MNYKKIILSIFLFLSIILPSSANKIDKAISESNFELKSTVSIYVQNMEKQKPIYKLNENKLLNPASSLKALTFGASYIALGKDYRFETVLYKDSLDNLYVKLGADPILTYDNLKALFANYTGNINTVYIDDSIIDKIPYPSGYMAEDMWPVSAKLTPYIVDRNKVNIVLRPSSLATNVDIIQNDPYKFSIINELKPSDVTDYKIERNYGEDSSILNFKGTVARNEIVTLPVINPSINFKIKLKKAIEDNKIVYTKEIENKIVPNDAKKITTISHSIQEVSNDILYNSNNYSSEIVFKVASSKYFKKQGTLEDSIKMFNEIFKDELKKADNEIRITDASGVSRNNLVTTKFIVNCLNKLSKVDGYKELLLTANTGTMKDRLPFLENNLKAKTGTLNGVSSISGYLTTSENTPIVFSIIIQNSMKRKAILKNFENKIIGLIYRYY